MASVVFWPKADVVEIPRGLSLSNARRSGGSCSSSRARDRRCFCGVMNDGSGGRRRTYWALVESVRTGRGSRQRVVAYLGELKRSEQSGWAATGPEALGQGEAAAVAVRSAALRRAVGRRAGAGAVAGRAAGAAAGLRRRVDGLGVVAAVGAGHAVGEVWRQPAGKKCLGRWWRRF